MVTSFPVASDARFMFEETSNPYYTHLPSSTFVLIIHITRKSEMNIVVMLPRGHLVAHRVGLQST